MKLLREVEFKLPKDYHSRTLYFYVYEGKYFRDFLFLETEAEYIEHRNNKTELHDCFENCYNEFLSVLNAQDGELIKLRES